MNQFIRRIIGAAALQTSTYEEIEADTSATPQALVVVVVSAVAAGIGASGSTAGGVSALVVFTLAALLGWTAWALLTLQIGARLLPSPQTKVDLGQLLRTIGFSSAPGLLSLLGLVAPWRAAVFAVIAVWMLLAMIVAVRQALDYRSTGRAVAVCAVGWALTLLIIWFIGLFSSPLA